MIFLGVLHKHIRKHAKANAQACLRINDGHQSLYNLHYYFTLILGDTQVLENKIKATTSLPRTRGNTIP